MRSLITGANGFIGRNLKEFINDPICVDIEDYEDIFNPDFDWISIDKIYHLGAISDTTETDFDKLYKYNINYSIRLFEKAIQHKIPVVYASSASVYGNHPDFEIDPLNLYALSKAAVEFWIKQNIDRFSNILCLRFHNVYGDDENKGDQSSPVFKFIKQAKETRVIKIFDMENNEAYRDFVYVNDVVRCMFFKLESGIYEVGTGQSITFKKVAELIANKYNARIEKIMFPPHLRRKYQYYTRADNRAFDIKFKSVEEYINEL